MSDPFINQDAEAQLLQLCKLGGAFLTVTQGDSMNTMTIGWGSIGFIWGKPVFMVLIDQEHFTPSILNQSSEFTVTIPRNEQFRDALLFCGTKSGRDLDKFAAAGLTTLPGKKIATPVIAGSAWQYECKVIYRQQMTNDCIVPSSVSEHQLQTENRPADMIYYGEILASYITE